VRWSIGRSPYLYQSGEYEILLEGGQWWLYYQCKAVGFGNRMRDAKELAERHAVDLAPEIGGAK